MHSGDCEKVELIDLKRLPLNGHGGPGVTMKRFICQVQVFPDLAAGRQDQDMIVAARTAFSDKGEVKVPTTAFAD
jgi:hypothetical protein